MFQHGETVSVFQFQGCADVWNKTAVKQCCRWLASFHASAHPWNWNKTLKQPETVLAFAHDETDIKQNCRRSAEMKPRPSAVLFYFSLFHQVRRALQTQLPHCYHFNHCHSPRVYLSGGPNHVEPCFLQLVPRFWATRQWSNIAARRFSYCVWNSLPSFLRTADSFTSFRSQGSSLLKAYVRKTFVAGPLSAPLIPLPDLSRVINSLFTTYLTV